MKDENTDWYLEFVTMYISICLTRGREKSVYLIFLIVEKDILLGNRSIIIDWVVSGMNDGNRIGVGERGKGGDY